MANPQRWMMPFLQGRCYDYALALAEKVTNPVFVAIGSEALPDHVGLRLGELYVDVRGVLDMKHFLHMRPGPAPELQPGAEDAIVVVDRSVVELHCGLAGMAPPYRGSRDMAEARRAVRRAMTEGYLDAEALAVASTESAAEPSIPGLRR